MKKNIAFTKAEELKNITEDLLYVELLMQDEKDLAILHSIDETLSAFIDLIKRDVKLTKEQEDFLEVIREQAFNMIAVAKSDEIIAKQKEYVDIVNKNSDDRGDKHLIAASYCELTAMFIISYENYNNNNIAIGA